MFVICLPKCSHWLTKPIVLINRLDVMLAVFYYDNKITLTQLRRMLMHNFDKIVLKRSIPASFWRFRFFLQSNNKYSINFNCINHSYSGREPWYSGYGKRLTFQRLWVYWMDIFSHISCKNFNDVCLKRLKINEKEAGVGPFF